MSIWSSESFNFVKTDQRYKTPEQIEFIDLMHELKTRFGFNASKIAEIADVSDAMISHIRAGKRSPGKDPIRRLREKYQEMTVPGKVTKEISRPTEMHDKIVYLEQNDPARLEAARITLDALYRDAKAAAPKRKRVSSVPVEKHIAGTVESWVAEAEALEKRDQQAQQASEQSGSAPLERGRQSDSKESGKKKHP